MYSIKLTNYAFDDTYSNIRLFDDKVSRERFFDAAEGSTQIVDNFNAGDLLYTQIIFDAQDSEPLQKLLNYNYAIVKLLDENKSVSSNNETLYFHIKKSRQASQQRIICDVELDPFMTYWYDIEFSDCLITRAHLDRFIRNEDDTFKFDGRAISNLFEREDIKDLSKRLVDRAKLKMFSKSDNQTTKNLCEWIDNNVAYWVYAVIDSQSYVASNGNVDIENTYFYKNSSSEESFSYTTACVCYPVMKSIFKSIKFEASGSDAQRGVDAGWGASSLTQFLLKNNGFTHVKTLKISIKPPFDLNNAVFDYTIENESILGFNYEYLKIKNRLLGNNKYYLFSTQQNNINDTFFISGLDWGLLIYNKDYQTEINFECNINLPQIEFNKEEIINQDRNIKFNPKLNNSDFKSLNITFAGNTFELPIDKINTTNPKFTYKEMITADLTKGICRFVSEDNENVFNEKYSQSFNGFVFTNDLSLPMSNSQFEMYLANNKNAYLSFQAQQNYNLTSAALRGSSIGVQSIARASVNPLNLVTGGAQIMENIGSAFLSNALNQTQFNLTIDNMKNAPENLVNANGNVAFITATAEFGIYVELYSALESELKIANDYAFENGYYFNQYGNIKDYCCTRKYFNYIEAVPDNIIGKVSNEIKQRIKSIISRGVRFWHVDEISYSKENYELMLEEA